MQYISYVAINFENAITRNFESFLMIILCYSWLCKNFNWFVFLADNKLLEQFALLQFSVFGLINNQFKESTKYCFHIAETQTVKKEKKENKVEQIFIFQNKVIHNFLRIVCFSCVFLSSWKVIYFFVYFGLFPHTKKVLMKNNLI